MEKNLLTRIIIMKLYCLSLFIWLAFHNDIIHAENISSIELGVKKSPFTYQSDIISSFIENNIPFYIDIEGILKYPGKYENVARDIMSRIDKTPLIKFYDFRSASIFIALLKKNKIEYRITCGSNDTVIHILYKDDDSDFIEKTIQPNFKKIIIDGSRTGVYRIE